MRWSPGRPLTATAASRLLSAAKTASSTKRTSARRNSARSYIRLGSCSGSRATGCCPRIGRVHCNFHLCAVHARLGGPRRLGKGPAILDVLVGGLIIVSMLLFSRLMQRLGDLQIGNVLHLLGDQGRAVIGEMFRRIDDASAAPHPAKTAASTARLGRVTQTVKYFGKPRTVAKLDVDSLVALAREGQGTIVMACAVGDTLVEGSALLHVHDSGTPLLEDALRRAVHLKRERTFEQDPKYPIRLLVDIAIKALSPAINDPTTAVQTIDQLEDPLRRLGAAELDAGYAVDANGALRLVFPTPTWEDYLSLALDEIRHFGSNSVQVMRRMRSALVGLADTLPSQERVETVRNYLEHLDRVIGASPFDVEDKRMARQEDRQGIGLSRRQSDAT